MDGDQSVLKAKDAIDAAFAVFRELFAGTKLTRVLLEGLEYLEDEGLWSVIIGFDLDEAQRKATKPKKMADIFVENPQLARNFREVLIRATDGAFVRMKTP